MKFIDFITRDVDDENQISKVVIISRIYCLISAVYLFGQSILLFLLDHMHLGPISLVFMTAFIVTFVSTYKNNIKNVAVFMELLTIAWICFYVFSLGWDCGAQHFLFVLLVFILVTRYISILKKSLVAVFLCAVRYGLFMYAKTHEPLITIPFPHSWISQFMSTAAIFASIATIVILFSKDSMRMEKKLVDYNNRIIKMASMDPLTQLYNRRGVLQYIENIVAQQKNDGKSLCVAIGDIDFFKKVNDTYGHAAGDEVLKAIAKCLDNAMEKVGTVARWGGEEFLLVFDGVNGDEAYYTLQAIRTKIKVIVVEYEGVSLSVTMTFGLEEYNPRLPIDDAFNAADKKLYMGKEQGRDKVVY